MEGSNLLSSRLPGFTSTRPQVTPLEEIIRKLGVTEQSFYR